MLMLESQIVPLTQPPPPHRLQVTYILMILITKSKQLNKNSTRCEWTFTSQIFPIFMYQNRCFSLRNHHRHTDCVSTSKLSLFIVSMKLLQNYRCDRLHTIIHTIQLYLYHYLPNNFLHLVSSLSPITWPVTSPTNSAVKRNIKKPELWF